MFPKVDACCGPHSFWRRMAGAGVDRRGMGGCWRPPPAPTPFFRGEFQTRKKFQNFEKSEQKYPRASPSFPRGHPRAVQSIPGNLKRAAAANSDSKLVTVIAAQEKRLLSLFQFVYLLTFQRLNRMFFYFVVYSTIGGFVAELKLC